MALGDVVIFAQARLDAGKKLHDFSTETFQLGIITSAVTPTATTADPRWGAGGTTNFSTNQVGTGGGYTGPVTLTGVTWTIVGGLPTMRGTCPQIPQNASGFTNGRWGIMFNNTDAGKRAVGFVDLGSDRSIVTGPLDVDFNGATNDIFTM